MKIRIAKSNFLEFDDRSLARSTSTLPAPLLAR